ncbi:hypothetical protein H0H92_013363 [Tricholoma furcatifolium]|nr:hypothetical protein H0H92_013363 [Tricholoma furcatifolium]
MARCAQGVAKTGIAEITDPSNLADAYSMMPLVWSLGTTVGPIIGGLLAEPATRWPIIFGKFPYFTLHPYFLPCAVAGLFSFLIALTAFIGLKESLPAALARVGKQSKNPELAERLLTDDNTNYGTIQNDETPKSDVDVPVPFRGLLIPQVLTPLLVYSFLSFVDMSSQVLMPLMFSTSIPVGGLGFDAYRIGVILSIFGFVNAVFQLVFMGKMVRAFGPRNILAMAQLSYVLNIGLFPFMSIFARRAGRVDATVWAIIVLQLVVRLTNGAGWGAIQILIVDSAPNKASLGATNGMGQAVGCIARSIGPSVASSLFSLSLQRNLLGGNLVYLVIIGFAFLGLRITYLLPQKLRSQRD